MSHLPETLNTTLRYCFYSWLNLKEKTVWQTLIQDWLRQFKRDVFVGYVIQWVQESCSSPCHYFYFKIQAIEVKEAKTEAVTINKGAKAEKTKKERMSCSFSTSLSSWRYFWWVLSFVVGQVRDITVRKLKQGWKRRRCGRGPSPLVPSPIVSCFESGSSFSLL